MSNEMFKLFPNLSATGTTLALLCASGFLASQPAAAQSGIVVVQCTRAASGRVAPRRRLRETGIVLHVIGASSRAIGST